MQTQINSYPSRAKGSCKSSYDNPHTAQINNFGENIFEQIERLIFKRFVYMSLCLKHKLNVQMNVRISDDRRWSVVCLFVRINCCGLNKCERSTCAHVCTWCWKCGHFRLAFFSQKHLLYMHENKSCDLQQQPKGEKKEQFAVNCEALYCNCSCDCDCFNTSKQANNVCCMNVSLWESSYVGVFVLVIWCSYEAILNTEKP